MEPQPADDWQLTINARHRIRATVATVGRYNHSSWRTVNIMLWTAIGFVLTQTVHPRTAFEIWIGAICFVLSALSTAGYIRTSFRSPKH